MKVQTFYCKFYFIFNLWCVWIFVNVLNKMTKLNRQIDVVILGFSLSSSEYEIYQPYQHISTIQWACANVIERVVWVCHVVSGTCSALQFHCSLFGDTAFLHSLFAVVLPQPLLHTQVLKRSELLYFGSDQSALSMQIVDCGDQVANAMYVFGGCYEQG